MTSQILKKNFESMLFLSMLLFFCTSTLFAQQTIPHRNHALTIHSTSRPNVPDSLTIVAVRVAFQQDNNRFTTGDGTFEPGNLSYLANPDITIDPLPHDQSYFKDHLQFAKNYFETVSGQKIHIDYRVLPDIYHLHQKMADYSPTGKTFTNEKLAKLIRDTWQTVAKQGGFSTAKLDPQKTAFIIFHAGVGRDVELVGTTLDKTPQDIPSLFLDQETLGNLLGDPNFSGFDINGSSFKVTNSIILPQTLSRPGEDITGQQYVLQLSLNGLLCASIGSYLGLPDLFNTKTGNSGIGRFGLMDGESFFSYHGLFPPEPSAWEKRYLGWQNPFRITKNQTGPISLPAASFHQNKSIAKYDLSSSEYFLIENRHRDPNKDGVILTFRQPDGTTVQKHFNNKDETFVNQGDGFTNLLPRGVVTNVSNFDWSLPGGLDAGADAIKGTSDDRPLNGGILIWHIDAGVISRDLQSQTVNANPQRRGVDLEEADGAQDIGRAINDNFSSEARGTPFDFWWKGNDASVITLSGDTLSFYQNRFGPDTRPSNDSNSGAPSFFELYDFSGNQPVATFRIRPRTRNHIQTISLATDSLADRTTFTSGDPPYFDAYPLELSLYKTQNDSFLIVPSQHSTYAINLNGNNSQIYDFQNGRPQQPYSGSRLILGEAPTKSLITLSAWQWDGSNWNHNWNIKAEANDAFLSSINGQTLLADFTTQRIDIGSGSFLLPLSAKEQRSASVNGTFTQLSNSFLSLQPAKKTYSVSSSDKRFYTGAIKLTARKTGFYLLTDQKLMVFDPNHFSQPQTIVKKTPLEWPSMIDFDDDGSLDFMYVNKATHELEARNIHGAMLRHFPIRPPNGTFFIGTPLVTVTQTGSRNIYIVTQDNLSMNIRGYNSEGNSLKGFPLYVGSISNKKNQPIHPLLSGQTLYAVSHNGGLKAWHLDNIRAVLWGNRYGNNPYNKVTGNLNIKGNQNPSASPILIKEETYNWPNPAHDFTNIRYQTSKAGRLSIKIITPGGSVVYNKQMQTQGGVPEEFRLSTQQWSNGLYLGMITANVEGKTSRKLIKIVVVH